MLDGLVSWTWKALDADAMHLAAQVLEGEHDFTSFRAVACQAAHARRRIVGVQVWRQGDFVYLDITANAFLHHMVRNIAGALMAVGTGEQPVEWIGEVLAARDRTRAGVTAPAGGLYLVSAHYPEEYRLPRPPRPPLFSS